jgi:hypothetical protein
MELSLAVLLLPQAKLGSYTHSYTDFCCKNHAHTPQRLRIKLPLLLVCIASLQTSANNMSSTKLDIGF